MNTLFISDLHLDGAWPEVSDHFMAFLANRASKASSLYILGDLFETWIGDDDDDPHKLAVGQALHTLSLQGVEIYFMHGNRDFVLGEDFARRAGMKLLGETCVLKLGTEQVGLVHGDTLCSDDVEYQKFRSLVRNPQWQQGMLARGLDERRAFARQARDASRGTMGDKAPEIMDVNQNTVEETMLELGVSTLIHGHTHRPAIHQFELAGRPARRIVLGDWYEQGSVLSWDGSGFELESLPRS
ncbi:MAG: UDP-2,3-diacylglucosamine diphosphatase [Gammaproteobacteria bacterium]|nr:UDP-2,3-diacylglucosamine diphosphatase [Gammaproteobacteria bacterium]